MSVLTYKNMNEIVVREFVIKYLALGRIVRITESFSGLISATDDGCLLFTVVSLV